MDDFDREIKTEFINEALMNLEEAEASFMELESSTERKPLLDKIFRLAHNLKGGARAVGFGDVAEFTHHLENLVQKIQRGEITLTSDLVSTLLKSNDRLTEMLSELKGNLEAKFNNGDLLSEIGKALSGQPLSAAVEAPAFNEIPVAELPTAVPNAADFFDTPTAVLAVAPAQAPASSTKASEKENEIIRVSLSKIDSLNDFVGELIVLQSVIQQQATRNTSSQLATSIGMMVKISKSIQSLSMSLRMLPVKPLVQKLQRVVRDTAKSLDKNVRFDILGDQLEIDKSVLDRLGDPLVHILRNAVDHGLESTADRTAKGKSAEGNVRLSFAHEGNHLIVEVSDDGKGIDAEVLKKKALEKKLIAESHNLTEKQLINLIFHPGFSTKAVTSEISGRGVGMDVVKTNLENIGGQVDITTQVGKGSVFRMQIPLSLAVIEGLVVVSERNRYVIPLSQVQETINLKTQKVFNSKLGIGSCFELRGTVVPIVGIDAALVGRNETRESENTALIVSVAGQLAAVVVKDVVRAQQIVIKPLTNGIQAQKGWIGSCVLGDGLPTLILSLVDLLEGRLVLSTTEERRKGFA